MLRRLIVSGLYDWAKFLTYLGDWLSPNTDQIWRDRRWQDWDAQRVTHSRGVCVKDNGPCPHAPHCPLICERIMGGWGAVNDLWTNLMGNHGPLN